jgi:hypothetical protein
MARIAYRQLTVILTVIIGLACAGLPAAAAAAPDKPVADAAGKLEVFPPYGVTLQSPSQAVAFDGKTGRITISTCQGDQFKRRAEATFGSVAQFKRYRSVHSASPTRHGIEIYCDSAEAEFTVLVDDKGIIEFRPGKARQLILRGLRLAYGLVPSLVGTDFLYDANTAAGAQRLHIPSLNLVLGLVDGGDCTAVGVWPPGEQSAAFGLESGAGAKFIDSFTFDTAGQSFYFSCQEKPGIWHAERLKRNYLEKDTTIAWKRPFEAKWLGRFFITSDEYDWPFYFGSKPAKIWGRYIRGWYTYPLRFDGDRTVVHFEKQFLPKGDLLIYCLEPHPTDPSNSIVTPAEVMALALGKEQAEKILDPEGTVEQTLLDHRLAVCAMTNTMQSWLNEGKVAEHREQIVRWCDDTAAFIRMIRQRDQAFAEFARALKASLSARVAERAGLAGSVGQLQESLTAIQGTCERELPSVELETVRQWTAEMKKAAVDNRSDGKKTFGKLGGQCRSVAGTQDDLARALSIQVIRLTEQAARLGVSSPQHARLAEEVIVKARQVLRKPTWWEPTRRFAPKSDPGNVF